jgi:hypothetical protein
MKTINGQQITEISPSSSRYPKGHLFVMDDKGNDYRIHVSEFLKLMNANVKFKVTKKKVHSYLTIESVHSS